MKLMKNAILIEMTVCEYSYETRYSKKIVAVDRSELDELEIFEDDDEAKERFFKTLDKEMGHFIPYEHVESVAFYYPGFEEGWELKRY